MKQRNDAYHEIESRQAGKLLLKRELKWTILLVFAVASLMIVYSFGSREVDFQAAMFMSTPSAKAFASKDFDYTLHFSIALFVTFLIYGLVHPMSYIQKLKQKEIIVQKGRALSLIDKAELAIWEFMDKVFFWGLWPISNIILNGIQDLDKDKIYMRWGWFSHLERGFFKQEFEKTDGNERAKKVVLLNRYQEYFTRASGKKSVASREFGFIVWLFKSKAELLDLIRIIEAYLSNKYDKNLTREEFLERLNKAGGLDGFKAFNGRDEVIFSHDLIKMLIDDESKKFEKFISTYAFDSRMSFSRKFRKYYDALMLDVNMEKYLFPKNGREQKILELKADREKMNKHVIFVLVCYFRFAIWKLILSQYDNIPAGIIVIKMRDYSIRMITEIFEDNTLINIVKNKNDGSTAKFESDNLVNLFLSCLHHYKISSEVPYTTRIESIFNFTGDEAFGAETGDKIASEINEFYKNDTDDWIGDMINSMREEA